MRTHVDLFSGIGGFALACKANGVQTIQFVEIDKRCRAFLAKAWPGVPIHDDIKTFRMADPVSAGSNYSTQQTSTEPDRHGQDGRIHLGSNRIQGRVWLLTGGVPCQPSSRAGRQLGAADARWLWPAALAALRSVKPTWALFENPPGIGDVGLAGILAEMEAQGYKVQVVSVGACAVGAPHRRMRYWIVAHDEEQRERPRERDQRTAHEGRENSPRTDIKHDASHGVVAHDECAGHQGPDAEPGAHGLHPEHSEGNFWSDSVLLPCADGKVRRAPDDTFLLAHGSPDIVCAELAETHRSLFAALGNSIVWLVAAQIIAAMIGAEDGQTES